ncbi:MAG: 4-(cytidine 5'-diphospho)-2-C-methyl-D-erythritol kinase [Mailhella sp.]|nr:4-(cytidine 5'-diphospho)-2-C-methyl-D-erythritol kinase [Mailhella sp.]
MPSEIVKSGCKINIYLKILGKRSDGYHELDTLFWPLPDPHDELEITWAGKGITVLCGRDGIDPNDNTLTRAYALYTSASGHAPGCIVHLAKGVPSGAGLGGGSADAAALLLKLNEYAPRPLDEEAMLAVASGVGADVPFFLRAEPCFAEGTGERLKPFRGHARKGFLVIVCPDVKVSTAKAYSLWDAAQKNLTDFCNVHKRDFPDSGKPLRYENDFEPVIFSEYPLLADIKKKLLDFSAYSALMTGSGSALYAVFFDGKSAQRAKDVLSGCKNLRVFGVYASVFPVSVDSDSVGV